jgi:hypothetical protein
MLKRSLLLCFSILLFATTYAQNFLEGYLVTSKGDTLKGYIAQQFQVRKEIRFKAEAGSSDFQNFLPADLRASYLKPVNEYYISRILDIDMKSVDIRHLEEDDPSPRFIHETIMIRILFKGKASLYAYEDNMKEHFFFQIENGGIRELMNIHYMDTKSHSEVILEGFKHQMKSEMPGCPINYDHTYYSESSLLKTFQKYNSCKGIASTIPVDTKTRTNKIFYAMAGVSVDHGSYSDITSDFSNTTSPNFGIGLEFRSNKITNRFSFTTELFLRTYSSTKALSASESATFRFDYPELAISVKYNVKGNLNPYIKGGPVINYLTRKVGDYTSDATGKIPYTDFNNVSFGFLAAAGISYNRLMVEGRYESTLMNGFPSGAFHVQSGILMVGYKIFQ